MKVSWKETWTETPSDDTANVPQAMVYSVFTCRKVVSMDEAALNSMCD